MVSDLHSTGMTLWQQLAENTADSVYIRWKSLEKNWTGVDCEK